MSAGLTVKTTLDETGSCMINLWPNDTLVPAGSVYKATAYTAKGQPVWQGEITVVTAPAIQYKYIFSQATTFFNTLRTVSSSGVIDTVTLTSSDSIYNNKGGFGNITGLVQDSSGNLYASDETLFCIWKISPYGVVTRVAGTGVSGPYSGDGGPATSANIGQPFNLAIDPAGNLYFPDLFNYVIRVINMQSTTQTLLGVSVSAGCIQRVAGIVGQPGYVADNVPATSTKIYPYGVAINPTTGALIDFDQEFRIRQISPTGTITTIAGNGTGGHTGDGGAATSAQIGDSLCGCFDSSGNLYFAEDADNLVIGTFKTATGVGPFPYYVNYSGGTFPNPLTANASLLVGKTVSIAGFDQNGNNGSYPCTSVSPLTLQNFYGINLATDTLGSPSATAVMSSDGFFLRVINTSGSTNNALGVSVGAGEIQTVCAFNSFGIFGYAGDGGNASEAQIKEVYAMTCDSSGNLYFCDSQNYRIRLITTSGGISTVAGTGTSGDTGDTGAATSAEINNFRGLSVYRA